MHSLGIGTALVFAVLAASCAGGGAVSDPNVLAQFEFLNLKSGMTRAEVTAQLGNPEYVYEQDRVISYPLFEQNGELLTKNPRGRSRVIQLMLRFSPEGRVERVALIERDY